MVAPPSRRFDMKDHERELSEGVDLLSDDELNAVSGGDEVAHLPQSIRIPSPSAAWR
jgi:bacteriocin-like protein